MGEAQGVCSLCLGTGVVPGSGAWFRPGPWFQSRGLGLWPDTGAGVWGDALWAACLKGPCPPFPTDELPRLGCDTSMGKGEDYFALHGRWGAVSLLHETVNTMDAVRIAGSLRTACETLADIATGHRAPSAEPIRPEQVPVVIDDDGTGNAVAALLRRDGFCVAPIGAATQAVRPDRYPNKRSELWFAAATRARAGLVYLGRLDRETRRRLRQQLMAPQWDLDGAGRRVVEPKDKTKEKIGRSPDDADAFNLCHHDGLFSTVPETLPHQAPPTTTRLAPRPRRAR